jgi:transposase-like protein
MGLFDPYGVRRASATTVDAGVPSACPACASTSIRTNAKAPDANSYWRCEGCGEVWNAARRQEPRYRASPWR